MGFSIGISPIVGFQYGAQNKAQLRRIYKTTFIFVSASSVVITVVAAVLAKPIVTIFTKDPGTWELASELCTLVLSVCMHAKYFIKKSEKNYILG